MDSFEEEDFGGNFKLLEKAINFSQNLINRLIVKTIIRRKKISEILRFVFYILHGNYNIVYFIFIQNGQLNMLIYA